MKFDPVYVTLKNDKIVLLREAHEEDAQMFSDSIREITETTDMLLKSEKYEPNIERQKEWMKKSSESPLVLNLIAVYDDKAVGNICVTGSIKPSKCDRTARIGMSAMKEWRGVGLGYALLDNAIKWAQTTQIEILWLEVFGSNAPAIALYQKTGFIENGRIKDFYRQISGKREDNVIMSLRIK